MKEFFKYMFASMAGFLIVFVIAFLFVMLVIGGLMSSLKTEEISTIKENTVLVIKLDRQIVERTSDNPLENIDFTSLETKKLYGLNDLLECIRKASEDQNIKGILLDISNFTSGIAIIEEVRRALDEFKKSNKFLIAYSDNYSLGGYYLASVCNEVYLHPQGLLDFKGLKAEVLFFKEALQKLEIEPQVIRHGKFKSAVEPFILDKMSEENREQMTVLLKSLWNNILQSISISRKVSESELDDIANNLKIRNAKDALKYKLVDALKYKDELLAEIKNKMGLGTEEKINSVSVDNYVKILNTSKKEFVADKIAVIMATGEIKDGDVKDDEISGELLSKEIRKARLNKNIKAIVLRVNSPGGSALASETIWREVALTKATKPVVVSMGDMAASGGYYISCAADKIFANKNTITGSIGVFGLLLNAKNLMKNKLGVTVDVVKTNEHADMGSLFKPLTKEETEHIQSWVEEIYDVFTKRVAEGRKIPQSFVDSIGQGRVWSGVDAKNIKLIDEWGGINDAIKEAAKLAKLENYNVVYYPSKKTGLEAILEMLSENKKDELVLVKYLGKAYKYYQQINSLLNQTSIQARIPYYFEIK